MIITKHLKHRMKERGITQDEVMMTLQNGWDAEDVQEGTIGKVYVFEYNRYWKDKFYPEKEVSVYFKYEGDTKILITAKARYGSGFPRGGKK